MNIIDNLFVDTGRVVAVEPHTRLGGDWGLDLVLMLPQETLFGFLIFFFL